MKDKAKFAGIVKDAVIVFLSLSAAFLFIRAVAFETSSAIGNVASVFGGSGSGGAAVSPSGEKSLLGSEPTFILVTAQDGSHYALKYDNQHKKEMFSRFSATLGEALGSSSAPVQITEEEFQQALRGNGVFFDYLYPQPLSSVAARLGTDISGNISDISARRLFLGGSGNKLILFFIDSSNGKFYYSETARSLSDLPTKILGYPFGNANFAFELGDDYKNIDPFYIFSGESESLPGLASLNPLQNGASVLDLFPLFGMNSNTSSKYSDDDGSLVYVDGDKTLRIESSGKVFFSTDGSGPAISGDSSSGGGLSVCSGIVQNSIALTSGSGDIGLAGIKGSSSSATEISYDYFAGGIPVLLPDDSYAADFWISGGSIVRAELYYRKYSFSGDPVIVLPEKQAAEIAKFSGGEPLLVYEDNGIGISGAWIIN